MGSATETPTAPAESPEPLVPVEKMADAASVSVTFQVLPQRLADICRYVSFSSLKTAVNTARSYVRFLRPDFLDEFAESWEIEDE
jgi:hypothetical protein